MEPYQPEIGQAIFGNPSREYEAPEWVEAMLSHLNDEIERVVWNAAQHQFEGPAANAGSYYVNDVFEMRAYYWGECECGFEQRDRQWPEEHKHPDSCWTHKWDQVHAEFSDKNTWKEPWRSRELGRAKELGWPFDSMDGIAVYCDCGVSRAYNEWRATNDHNTNCPTILPNFRCGNVEVSWYKHLGRGMSMNREVSANEMAAILDRCLESVRRDSQADFAGANINPSLTELRKMGRQR